MPVLKGKTFRAPARARTEPLWRGPCDDGPNGGITFSMLSRFLTCPERFRVKYVVGVEPVPKFSHRIEYGQMWHACEEALAAKRDWATSLVEYVKPLLATYPMDRDEINKWYNVCKVQFPLYVEYWRKHPDVKKRTPLFQEQVFRVPYRLPSGATVWLRGKWDSVDVIDGGIYLQENKTKGEVDEVAIRRQLTYDLQTMLYLVALRQEQRGKAATDRSTLSRHDVKGVRYNVVRRPLSGGKGSIVRHKPSKSNPAGESEKDYYSRLSGVIAEDLPSYFARWKFDVTPADLARFERECLSTILERLVKWYECIKYATESGLDPFSFVRKDPSAFSDWSRGVHYRHPFGVVNTVDEYGFGDIDEHLATGSMVGLQQVEKLFKELQ